MAQRISGSLPREVAYSNGPGGVRTTIRSVCRATQHDCEALLVLDVSPSSASLSQLPAPPDSLRVEGSVKQNWFVPAGRGQYGAGGATARGTARGGGPTARGTPRGGAS